MKTKNYFNLKSWLLMMLMLIGVGGNLWAEEVSFIFTGESPNCTNVSGTVSGINYNTGKTGSASPTAYNTKNGLVLYAVSGGGGYFNTTTAINGSITNVTVTTNNKKNSPKYTVYGSKNGSDWKQMGNQTSGGNTNSFDTSDGYTYVKIANTTNATAQLGINSIVITYARSNYTITAQSNNTNYGIVSLSGSVITGSPETGCRYAEPAYTVSPANSATVVQNGNAFTVTPSANTTVTINFEAIPTYTVTLGDDNSTLAEEIGNAGVNLPTRSALNGYDFAGWSETNVATETTTAPTIIPAGAYAPTADITLYPVYTKTVGGGGTTHETASVTISDYANTNNWSNGTKYTSVTLDENVTATASGTSNTGKYYTTGNSWRIYASESGKLILNASNGAELTAATISFSNSTLSFGGDNITSGSEVLLSGTSAEFTAGGTTYITAISVDYAITGAGTTYYWSTPVAAAVEVPSIVVAENPFLFSTTATITCATEGAAIKYSFDGENWNDYTSALTITENKTIYAKAIKGENESEVAQVNATKNLAEPNVTISGDLTLDLDGETNVNAGTLTAAVTYNNAAVEGATVTWSSSNPDVATIDASGTVTIKTTGEVTFTATYAGNSDYAEATGTKIVTVIDNNAPGSAGNPYSVANAIYEINNGGNVTNVYVSGIVSQVDSYNDKFKSITYWISGDGTTESQLECYSGKGLNGADFSSINDIQVGDIVTVAGTLKKYNDIYEFNYNNYLASFKRPVYEITAKSNNEDLGTVSLEGNIITATLKDGSRYADPAFTVDAEGEVTVEQDGNEFVVVAKSNCTVTINFEAIPTHKVTWSINGETSEETVAEGAALSHETPADIDGKTFVGWVTEVINGETDEVPTFVTSATMGTSDLKYYAVFASQEAEASLYEKTDDLTREFTGVEEKASYVEWSGKTATSSAVYAGQSAGDKNSIQLRSNNSNSGVISTTSGGKLAKVVVVWNSETASGRTLDIYGSNTAYEAPTDLYDNSKQGTKLGSIVNGTSTELAITGDYKYIGLRSASGAMYLNSISITWEGGTPATYSGYCTTVDVPIRISTVEELKAFRDAVNGGNQFAGKTVKLAADLDLSGEENWTPIGNLVAYPGQSFNGVFDGDGHKISNVTVVDNTPNYAVAGLFGSVVNGTIKNLTVENVNLTSSHYAGGIVAYTSNGPTIENCHVIGGTITSVPELLNGSYDNGDKVGGIFGIANGDGSTINNCTVEDLTIKGYRDLGGIAGRSVGTVTNNTVKNTTIIQSDVNAYKDYEITTYDYIVGATSTTTKLENNVYEEQNNVLTIDGAVAKIGDKLYRKLQAAVDAAQQLGGEQTINLLGNISGEAVTIKEVANFKLTIDGKKDAESNYTVNAQIIVDGLCGNGGSNTNGASVTLQNIAFVNNAAKDAILPSHYPHHLTIQNCSYAGSEESLNNWFVNVSDGPLYGATIKDVTVEHSRLIQGNLGLDVVFENIVATNDVKCGFNIKTEGTVLIKDCQVTTAKYAFRDYKEAYTGIITLEGNTFISTSEESDEGAIVNRGGAVGTAHINVVSGTYSGHIKVLNNKEGVLAISGGYFSAEFPQEYIAEELVAQGKVCVPAADKPGYFTVGDPIYVAQPIIFHDGGEYEGELTVAIAGEGVKYTLNGGAEQTYSAPFTISDEGEYTIKAWAEQDGIKSAEVSKTFTIVTKPAGPSVTDGYYTIKTNEGKFVNVAGRKTVTLVENAEGMPGTVIRVKATDGKVETLRSQGVDVPSYAQKAMNYVPEIVRLAVDKLHAEGAGELLGEHGLDAIMTKFDESFDYNLYLEGENNTYRIYGRTPSMKPVVDFYAENKDNVDAKLPQLEQFINNAIDKVLEKTGGRGAGILVDFELHKVWQNMGGTLTEPVDEASTAKFYEEVLTSEANVWNFAYQTAMIYWGNLKNNDTFKNNLDKLGDYAKYIDKVENIQPNFKYYIVPSATGVDFISEGNVAITDNDPSVAWTMEPVSEFKVNFDVELNHTVYSTNGGVQDEYKEYYTTLYTDFAYTVPDGVKVYKVKEISDKGVAVREEIEGTIPAQTPVMLVSSNEGAQALTLSTEDGAAVTGNLLVGADELINQYQLKTSQVEGLFKMAKDVIGESAYNEYLSKYEHLMLTNAGTVNNKYFFGLSDEDIAKCVFKNENNEEDCVIRSLSTGDEKIGFYNNWTAGANKGFLVTSDFNPVKLSLVGDVDRDGKISISDVTALVNIILGKATYPKDNDKYDFEAAEVDGDKKISISDVTKLVNMILGKE